MKYYVLIEEETRGPFEREELQQMIRDGTAALDTPTAAVGDTDWAPLSKIMSQAEPRAVAPIPEQPTAKPPEKKKKRREEIYLNSVRKRTCYPRYRAMINSVMNIIDILFIVVGGVIALVLIAILQNEISKLGDLLTWFLALFVWGASYLIARSLFELFREISFIVVDMADVLIRWRAREETVDKIGLEVDPSNGSEAAKIARERVDISTIGDVKTELD
jgi:hypothetical protein